MQQVVLLGDPHVGKGQTQGRSGIGATLNSRIADQMDLLDWTLERTLERHSHDIIITGDMFEDNRPHPTLITMVIGWLKKCQAHGVRVRILLGNHDMLRAGSVFTSSLDIITEMDLEGITVHKNINTILIGNTAFTLLPFRDRKSFGVQSSVEALSIIADQLLYELAGIPATCKKMVVGHLAIEGSIPVGDEIDDMTNELFCPIEMFRGYDYVWMGHVHKAQVLHKNNPYVAHVGSMDISNFGETDQKKRLTIIDCDSLNHDYDIEYLPTRPLKKLSVTVPKDTQDPTAYVISELEKQGTMDRAIVKVEVALEAPELKSVNRKDLEAYLTKQGVFNVSGISESRKANLIKKDVFSATNIDTRMDVPTAIKAYAEAHVDVCARADFIELSMEIWKEYKEEGKE
jgi:DNA repair exonuclease SbcCD nuclease subunit